MTKPKVHVLRGARRGYVCPRCGGAMGVAVGVKMVCVNVEGTPVAICSACAATRGNGERSYVNVD